MRKSAFYCRLNRHHPPLSAAARIPPPTALNGKAQESAGDPADIRWPKPIYPLCPFTGDYIKKPSPKSNHSKREISEPDT
jgi:hypothetical protein